MKSTLTFVSINSQIVKLSDIKKIDLSTLKTETIIITMEDGEEYSVNGFAALELIWLIKPSVLEGNPNIKFNKHMWTIHNLFAHPLMQILAWFKRYERAIWIHDITVPKPRGFK